MSLYSSWLPEQNGVDILSDFNSPSPLHVPPVFLFTNMSVTEDVVETHATAANECDSFSW